MAKYTLLWPNCSQQLIKKIIMKQQQQHVNQVQDQKQLSQQQSSFYSSEDQDAVLLTEKVQQKLLQTVAKIRNKDPSIYKVVNPIFAEQDFEQQQRDNKGKKGRDKKFTYKDLVKSGPGQQLQEEWQEQQSQESLPPAIEEKKAKNKFKEALMKQKNIIEETASQQQDLFTVKRKLKKQTNNKQINNQQKNNQNTITQFQPQQKQSKKEKKQQSLSKTSKLISKVWNPSTPLDETDIFLRDYIMNKKWLSKHIDGQKLQEHEKIDQEDEERSIQMDEHEARYNFRFEQPDGDKIVQYPRKIEESMRIKPESRKQKRKKVQERKAQQEKKIRQQAEQKRQQLKQNILLKLQQKQQQQAQQAQLMDQQQQQSPSFEHDWFFCDDCGKAFHQEETNYQCQQCVDYMLCQQCYELIIHKHPLHKSMVPIGYGAPQQSITNKILSRLQPCKVCRRKIPHTLKHYSYEDRAKNLSLMCERCYDDSPLDLKKKFSPVEPKINSLNIQEYLQKDPEKVKQLTNSKQVQQMVDQYLKYQFQDVIGGGLKTKFKYINVQPQSYGLSDQQILFGDDKQLNKYVSIKKLVPYRDSAMKLRNNIYNKKVKTINKSVSQNKKLIQKDGVERRLKKSRVMDKMKRRAQVMKKKRQNKLKILNVSNPLNQKKLFVPSTRLASYGVTLEKKA